MALVGLVWFGLVWLVWNRFFRIVYWNGLLEYFWFEKSKRAKSPPSSIDLGLVWHRFYCFRKKKKEQAHRTTQEVTTQEKESEVHRTTQDNPCHERLWEISASTRRKQVNQIPTTTGALSTINPKQSKVRPGPPSLGETTMARANGMSQDQSTCPRHIKNSTRGN